MCRMLLFKQEAKLALNVFHLFKELQKTRKFSGKKTRKMNIFTRKTIFKQITIIGNYNILRYYKNTVFNFYYRGGLMRGDIIIGINENTISKSKDIYNEVKKGETIIVKVLRNGNIFYLNIEPEIVSRL